MAKVTSKLQLTLPKAVADQYGIRPGDDLEFIPAGDTIRVVPRNRSRQHQPARSVEERLRLFNRMLERQRRREAGRPKAPSGSEEPANRGWKREDLYTRGGPR